MSMTHVSPRQRPGLVLTAFTLLVFCTGAAEYLVSGVLPQLADNFSVSVATAGQAVTAYALGVAIGGPIITAATTRIPRKTLALYLSAVFVLGMVTVVVAPSFWLVIVGRVVSASSQATLFAIGLTTTTSLLGEGKQGRAIAIVGSGLTVATVLGVPLGAFLSGLTTWRAPFVIIAVCAVLALALLAWVMPRTDAPTTGVVDEIRNLAHLPVLLAVGTTVVGFAGVSVVFTYLVPLLSQVTGISAGIIPAVLFAYGVGGFAGNLVAGHLADISLGKTLVGVFVALAVTCALFPFVAPLPIPMIVLVLALGVLSTATIAPLQSLVLRHASAAPTLSLAVNVSAFNLAIAVGSALGGFGVSAGLLRWNGIAGAVFALAGLLLTSLALKAKVRAD